MFGYTKWSLINYLCDLEVRKQLTKVLKIRVLQEFKVNPLFSLFVADLLSIREIRRPTKFSTDKGLGSTSWRVNLHIPIVFRVASIFPMFHSEDTFRSIFLALVKRLETPNAFSKNFLFLLPTKRETVFAFLNHKRQGSEEQGHNRAEKRQL